MRMKFAAFLLALILCVLLFAKTTGAGQSDESSVRKDRLRSVNCRYIKKNGYCKYSFVENKLCYTTCRCKDRLSTKSCKQVKAKFKCKTSWSITSCRYTCDQCSRISCRSIFPLGIKSGAIPDSKITASSTHAAGYGPARGRLDIKGAGSKVGAWCVRYNNGHQWLQVDLGEPTKVTHIATQGRQDYKQWVRSYRLQYSLNGRRFTYYRGGTVLRGNSDRNTVVKHALHPPIIARFIRVRPKTWYGHISMRMELYGCI